MLSVNSCREVDSMAYCSMFDICEPDGNGCRINRCKEIINEYNYTFISLNETALNKYKWDINNTKYEEDKEEITNYAQAEELNNIINEKYSILATSEIFLKGPNGCKEINNCSDIKF